MRERKLKCPECCHALESICDKDDESTHYCPYCKSYWLIVWEGRE